MGQFIKKILSIFLCFSSFAFAAESDLVATQYQNRKLNTWCVLPYSIDQNKEAAILLASFSRNSSESYGHWEGFTAKNEPLLSLEHAFQKFNETLVGIVGADSPNYVGKFYEAPSLIAVNEHCKLGQLMLQVENPAEIAKMLNEREQGVKPTEKTSFKWVKLRHLAETLRKVRAVCLLQKKLPSQMSEVFQVQYKDTYLPLSNTFIETMLVHFLNQEDGIHELLKGIKPVFSSLSNDINSELLWSPLFFINTSDLEKYKEFERLFADKNWKVGHSAIDLKEIEATSLEGVIHKASSLPDHILVESTSLDIEGEEADVHVKYLVDHLEEYLGKKAIWNVFLAFKDLDYIYVFQGKIEGSIVASRGGSSSGFDTCFLPEGSEQTLAEAKPDSVNARAQAVSALTRADIYYQGPASNDWQVSWLD